MIEVPEKIQKAYSETWFREIGMDEDQVRQMVGIELAEPMRWRIAALAAVMSAVRRDVAEEIARAIEVANGDRCPECGGKPASNKWGKPNGPLVKVGRCGGGHTWEVRSNHWVDPAQVARDQARTNAGSDPAGGAS